MKSKNKLVIFTDATCDLPQEIVDELGIKVIPMSCTINGRDYTNEGDDCISAKSVYDAMRLKQKTSTGKIAPPTYEKHFEVELKKGNDILHINLSSALSGSFESAQQVKQQLEKKYPSTKLYLVDSLNASLGEGLVVYKAAKYYDKNKDTEKTYTYTKELVKKVCSVFTVADLKYLRAGGRISAAKAIIGALLNVKPILHVDSSGYLIPVTKVMGRAKSLGKMADMMGKTQIRENNDTIMIGHGDCLTDAREVGQLVQKKFGIKNVIYSYIGSVIGSHSGPGTLAIFFEGENKGI